MKLPLWLDRILTNRDGTAAYGVGKADGFNNTVYLGDLRTGAKLNVPESFPEHDARYHCRIHPNNGFRVLAERIRAKKPDANKAPRPLWRQRMQKPWEPGTLDGNWVVDGTLVKEINLKAVAPERADRLYVSTSGGTDTFVWVDSRSGQQAKATFTGATTAWAKHAYGVKGRQVSNGFDYNNVLLHEGCHWQLAGVRKKTVWVPEPEVVKPEPIATAGVTTGRVSAANPLLAAPYGNRDIYKELADSLGTSRGSAAIRAQLQPFVLTQPKSFVFDFAAMERLMMAYCVRDVLGTPKPPIGVKPRNLHDEERANALDEAMVRYLNDDLPFPIEWAVEWNELRARLNKEQK